MPSQVVSLRLDENTIALMDQLTTLTERSRSKLVRDALQACAGMGRLAAERANATMAEILRRYGESAVLSIFIEGEEGDERAVAMIDGETRDDVKAYPVIEPDEGLVHLFVDVPDWTPDTSHGATRLGSSMFLTQPVHSIGALPWPTPPNTGLVARLERWAAWDMGAEITKAATTNHR